MVLTLAHRYRLARGQKPGTWSYRAGRVNVGLMSRIILHASGFLRAFVNAK